MKWHSIMTIHQKIDKIGHKRNKFIKESMVKMGLKGRSLISIRRKLGDLLKNNWTFTKESRRPQVTNTLVSDGDPWTDVDIKKLLKLRYDDRRSAKEIAAILSRKESGIEHKLVRLPKPRIIENSKNFRWSQKYVEKYMQ